jgi:hypothetical protein
MRRFSFALHACVVPLISASACVLPRETTMHALAWHGHGDLSAQTRTPRLVTGRAWGSAGPSSVPGDHDFTTDSGPALRWAGWNDARGKTDSLGDAAVQDATEGRMPKQRPRRRRDAPVSLVRSVALHLHGRFVLSAKAPRGLHGRHQAGHVVPQ